MVSKKEGAERLKTLYSILDGMPDDRCRLRVWRGLDCGTSCGTVACAGGWATLYPPFQAMGLSWRVVSNAPLFDGLISFPAIDAFFGIHDRNLTITMFTGGRGGQDDSHPLGEVRDEGEHHVRSERLVIMRRIARYLLLTGSISKSRYAELSSAWGGV